MNMIKPYIKASARLFVTSAIPLAILTLLYRYIFNFEFKWSILIYYLPIFCLASAHHYMPSSVITAIPSSDGFSTNLKTKLERAPWEIIDENGEGLTLRPKFDKPYSLIFREKVLVDLSAKKVGLIGSKIYIRKLQALLEGKKTFWDKKPVWAISYLIIIIALLLPAFYKYGLINDLKIRIHEYKTRDVAILELENTGIPGNSEGNLNSYGGAVENEDFFFYVKEGLKLCRSDKNFVNEKVLIDKTGGTGISYLNAAGEWIYFASGKTLNRIRTDGSGQETIYAMGYLLDVHLLDNSIYFINHGDLSKLYKMDINGKNPHPLSGAKVVDFSIFENRIYFSHENDGRGVLESMDLDGLDKRSVADILPFDMVRNGNVLYYTDKRDFNLYKYKLDGTGEPEKLVDEKLSRFIIAGGWIYYSLKSDDVYYPGKGLYRIGLEGENVEKITGNRSIEKLSLIGDWILFHSSKNEGWSTQKRMSHENLTIIEMN